ncbi:hypothetical protein BDZ91DRAFT_768570 [Kalaharituber pfeilii]|nr:hypothetical protein BDZ91DRAFT_768570 [Kalaharituber pfeilii]
MSNNTYTNVPVILWKNRTTTQDSRDRLADATMKAELVLESIVAWCRAILRSPNAPEMLGSKLNKLFTDQEEALVRIRQASQLYGVRLQAPTPKNSAAKANVDYSKYFRAFMYGELQHTKTQLDDAQGLAEGARSLMGEIGAIACMCVVPEIEHETELIEICKSLVNPAERWQDDVISHLKQVRS